MGNGSAFMIGNFDQYVVVKYVAGVKVITKKNKNPNEPDNTPMYSHTPNTMYARRDMSGKVVQISVYENNVKIKDIDWGHNHDSFKKGEIHVQTYVNSMRQKGARHPTEDESRLAEKVRSEDDK